VYYCVSPPSKLLCPCEGREGRGVSQSEEGMEGESEGESKGERRKAALGRVGRWKERLELTGEAGRQLLW
jgi:hypothetical protein